VINPQRVSNVNVEGDVASAMVADILSVHPYSGFVIHTSKSKEQPSAIGAIKVLGVEFQFIPEYFVSTSVMES
jgi:hypothetical protein